MFRYLVHCPLLGAFDQVRKAKNENAEVLGMWKVANARANAAEKVVWEAEAIEQPLLKGPVRVEKSEGDSTGTHTKAVGHIEQRVGEGVGSLRSGENERMQNEIKHSAKTSAGNVFVAGRQACRFPACRPEQRTHVSHQHRDAQMSLWLITQSCVTALCPLSAPQPDGTSRRSSSQTRPGPGLTTGDQDVNSVVTDAETETIIAPCDNHELEVTAGDGSDEADDDMVMAMRLLEDDYRELHVDRWTDINYFNVRVCLPAYRS